MKHFTAPWRPKIQRSSEDRAKYSKIKTRSIQPMCRTAHTMVPHYNSTKYRSTETVLLVSPFLQINITSQMWPSGGKGAELCLISEAKPSVYQAFEWWATTGSRGNFCSSPEDHLWCYPFLWHKPEINELMHVRSYQAP